MWSELFAMEINMKITWYSGWLLIEHIYEHGTYYNIIPLGYNKVYNDCSELSQGIWQ